MIRMSKLLKWSRRAFIGISTVGVGGALVVGVAIRPGDRRDLVTKDVSDDDEHLLNLWVKIGEDDQVTAIVPHSEMGQGAQTALAQLLAEEMDADWTKISVIEAPATDEYANWALIKGFVAGMSGSDLTEMPSFIVPSADGLFLTLAKTMGMQITGGSASIATTGIYGMRVAGAAAREMLTKAAAAQWGISEKGITVSNGQVIHSANGQKKLFGQLAKDASQFIPSRSPKLKESSEFSIVGKDIPRLDIPSKVDGTAQFGIDASVPGLKYAAVKAAPVFGAKLDSVDEKKDRDIKGIEAIVKLDNAVAVVADSYWVAQKYLDQLSISWSETANGSVSSDRLYEQFSTDIDTAISSKQLESDIEEGDAAQAISQSKEIIEAVYKVPFLAHACMEPMNATVSINEEGCQIWTGTQNPLGLRNDVAKALELEPHQVKVNQHFMGGGFGRRAFTDFAVQAALIAKQVKQPIKVIWSRPEDIQHDLYRPAVVSKFRASLDDTGDLISWENTYHEKHEPAEAPVIPYKVPHKSIKHAKSPTHVPFGYWRSVDHSQHGFFTEGFLDEVISAAGKDAYLYRRELLSHLPRYQRVLDLAAEKSLWSSKVREGQGRGISIQHSFGSLVAQVVEVHYEDKKIHVDKVTVAVDVGLAVSPDGVAAQMESGIIYGLSAALYGEIWIENGAVKQSNYDDYPVVRMSDAPVIETHIINSGEQWGGAGEPSTPGIAPALAGAIYQATGTRIRELPISKYDFEYKQAETEEII